MTTTAPYHAELAEGPEGFAAYWAQTSDGMRVRASACACGSRGTVIVFPGRTEFAEKYGQVFHRLADLDVSIAAIDWRGQGLSDRYEASPTLGHVEDFRDYQRDVEALLSVDAVRQLPRPWVLLGHSMGACIGLRTLLERADFSGAIVSDGVLPDRALNLDFARKLREAGPWGAGFPEPVWSGDFEVVDQRTVGEKHLKLRVRPADGGNAVDAIAFNQAGPAHRGVVQLAYRLDVNEYRGFESAQLVVEQIAPIQARGA